MAEVRGDRTISIDLSPLAISQRHREHIIQSQALPTMDRRVTLHDDASATVQDSVRVLEE